MMKLECAKGMNNLDRSTVRTSDFKSENQGSIPCRGVFYLYLFLLMPYQIRSGG